MLYLTCIQGLEGESRILSKRISAAVSISSVEDTEPSYQPRPSYTQQRTSSDRTDPPRIANSNGTSSKRSRTYSSPKLSEIPTKARSPDISARAQYQYSEPKPTRIPKARGRTGSITGNSASQSPYPYTPQLPPVDPPDLRRDGLLAPAKLTNKPSQDTIHIPMKQTSGLLNEPPPFMPGPESANSHDDTPPRPSNDSEERPFEHWYRGEVSRNGGVGELKLGKRAEMLEIANYGHTLKQKQALAAEREAADATPRRRKRSESTAGAHRESLYLDDEHANGVGRVLDEGPLTDVDAEMSDVDYYNQQHRQLDTSTASAPDRQYRTTTPTPQTRTRIPSPVPTPPQQLPRGTSEPPSFPASSSSLSQSARQLQNPKRAATASPPAASSSASKKPRAAATPKAKPKAKPARAKTVAADENNRRSVAYYPSPGDDEDMADAIPSWTQPVAPSTGRWDDVVLPVVARKKGLDRLYEQADGSPKPKKVEEPVAPAPGTFGWDHSKYRPPRDGDIQMDEFGRPVARIPEDDDEDERQRAFGSPLYPPTEHDLRPVGPQQARAPPTKVEPPRSPVPFADYAPGGAANVNIDLEAAQMKYGAQPPPPPADDDGGAGCCKCVVM
ncbi:hypothetical protein B0H17DRAFT_438060 [Mycena rosella]|uniref:Uncharacterized protein n=1 Tax=Mycena rosella TaxID=1033263 RepID=A0AAD7FYB6_MYCRO|nr:hypothetical protein B0H17DRAFT_438060 [Mycena rosella]